MRMAVAAKRSLGVSAKFIGGKLLTTGALAYVEPEKVLRTDGALQDAIAGKLTLADWTKLVGLLNHLVCILLMPYYIMYDVAVGVPPLLGSSGAPSSIALTPAVAHRS